MENKIDLKKISTLTLSFIGDGVYDLLVREYLISKGDKPVGELNNEKVKFVNCKTQSDMILMLQDDLTEDEIDIFKRGRNTKVNSTSKHGSLSEYHNATGLEALFGYLYLDKQEKRIKELFHLITKDLDKNE